MEAKVPITVFKNKFNHCGRSQLNGKMLTKMTKHYQNASRSSTLTQGCGLHNPSETPVNNIDWRRIPLHKRILLFLYVTPSLSTPPSHLHPSKWVLCFIWPIYLIHKSNAQLPTCYLCYSNNLQSRHAVVS